MNAVRTHLLAEELASLHALSRSPGPICETHRRTLIRCGFAAESDGAFQVTPLGCAKLVYETTRASWLASAHSEETKGSYGRDSRNGKERRRRREALHGLGLLLPHAARSSAA